MDRASMRVVARSAASPMSGGRTQRLRHLRRTSSVVGHSGSQLFPWRRRPTPYSVLLAEVLLQNTPSERVVPVFEDVLRRWPTFQRLAGASVATLAAVLQPLG